WCSMLTHYTSEGRIDWPRMDAHLNFMRPWINGFLVAGPAGDSDTLDVATRQQLLQWANARLKPRREFLLAATLLNLDLAAGLRAAIDHKNDPTSFVGLHVQVTEKTAIASIEKNM